MTSTNDRPRPRRGRPRVGTLIPGVRLRDDEIAAVEARQAADDCDRVEALRRILRDGAGLDPAQP